MPFAFNLTVSSLVLRFDTLAKNAYWCAAHSRGFKRIRAFLSEEEVFDFELARMCITREEWDGLEDGDITVLGAGRFYGLLLFIGLNGYQMLIYSTRALVLAHRAEIKSHQPWGSSP